MQPSHKELNHRLEQLLDWEGETPPTADIAAGLRVADLMEARGYGFSLTDLHPDDPGRALWRAVFIASDREHAAEDPEGAVAICAAAAEALEAARP